MKVRRPRQDNADSFTLLGADYLRAWMLLEQVECPPSLEVFNEGYFGSTIEEAPKSAAEYADYLVNHYRRDDNSGSVVVGEGKLAKRYYKPWYQFNEFVGRLVGL